MDPTGKVWGGREMGGCGGREAAAHLPGRCPSPALHSPALVGWRLGGGRGGGGSRPKPQPKPGTFQGATSTLSSQTSTCQGNKTGFQEAPAARRSVFTPSEA